MPHNTIKLQPGVETNTTLALNQAAYSASQLIRFLPERNGLGLAQKFGGWVNYYASAISSKIRALKGWADLNAVNHLGIGAETSLSVLTNGTLTTITPQQTTTDSTANFSTSSTTNPTIVTVTDYGVNNPSLYSYVDYPAPVAVGGLVLTGPYLLQSSSPAVNATTTGASGTGSTATITFAAQPVAAPIGSTVVISGVTPTGYNGVYTVTGSSTTSVSFASSTTGSQTVAGKAQYGATYTINAGVPATSTVTSGGASYSFTTTSGSSIVTGTLANHGYQVGTQFYVYEPTAVGGITISGVYTVLSVPTLNTFTFAANATATSGATVSINGGLINSVYYIALAPQSTGSSGFGGGSFGAGPFGSGSTSTSVSGTSITATDWTLDNFGQDLIACPAGGPIYYWDPNGLVQNAQILGGTAPLVNSGIFVAMPERQVVAYGSSFTLSPDPMLIRWSDVGDFTSWNATVTNQAGSYRIPTGSVIYAGIQGPQQGLFWTDLDLWAMQYVGPPFVYGFNKIGSNCGAVSRHCVGQFNGAVYWMSQKQFFMSMGSGPQAIPCPIWDVVFQNINQAYISKVCCGVNTQFNEITWYYPSANSTENDSYVKFNVSLAQWDYGTLGRTAWIDQSVLGAPIGAGSDNWLYQHEVGNNATYNGVTTPMVSSFQTGYFQLNEADNLIFIDQIWPDMKWNTFSNSASNASVNITFYGTNYPGDAPTQYGPYTMTSTTEYISVRIRARLMSIALSSTGLSPSDLNTFWRLGAVRYRYQLDGKF